MNIVTKSDTKVFLKLLKIGLLHGRRKGLKTYTSTDTYDGTDVPKEHFLSLELTCFVSHEHVEKLLQDDLTENEINDILGL